MKDIGRRLRVRREELGLSLEQVQAQTKIRRRYIEALEAGKEDVIPGEVYVKGFLRFYANALGLDGLAFVKEYNEWKQAQAAEAEAAALAARHARRGPPRPPAKTPAKVSVPAKAPAAARSPAAAPAPAAGAAVSAQSAIAIVTQAPPQPLQALRPGSVKRSGSLERMLVSAALILVIVVAAALWYSWSHAGPAAGGDTGSGNGGSPPVGGGTVPGGSGTGSNGSGSSGGPSDHDGNEGTAPGTGSGDGTGDSGTTPAAHWALVSQSAGQAAYVVYGAPFTVSIQVMSEKCWIQVTSDGQVVFEKTLDAGVTGQWTAQKSLEVRFGRPQLVNVGVDGETLGPAGQKDEPRTLEFEAGSPPGGGTGTGGAGSGQTGPG